jgi:hypothetical protein
MLLFRLAVLTEWIMPPVKIKEKRIICPPIIEKIENHAENQPRRAPDS